MRKIRASNVEPLTPFIFFSPFFLPPAQNFNGAVFQGEWEEVKFLVLVVVVGLRGGGGGSTQNAPSIHAPPIRLATPWRRGRATKRVLEAGGKRGTQTVGVAGWSWSWSAGRLGKMEGGGGEGLLPQRGYFFSRTVQMHRVHGRGMIWSLAEFNKTM